LQFVFGAQSDWAFGFHRQCSEGFPAGLSENLTLFGEAFLQMKMSELD